MSMTSKVCISSFIFLINRKTLRTRSLIFPTEGTSLGLSADTLPPLTGNLKYFDITFPSCEGRTKRLALYLFI